MPFSKYRIIAKALRVHTKRLDREDELVVGVRNHTVNMLATETLQG